MDALDPAQEAVALVEVEDAGVEAQGAQRAHAADPEHDLLTKTAVRLWHVEAIGDAAQVVRVGLEVGVEQEKGHPSHLRAPHRDAHVARPDRRLDLDPLDLAHR